MLTTFVFKIENAHSKAFIWCMGKLKKMIDPGKGSLEHMLFKLGN